MNESSRSYKTDQQLVHSIWPEWDLLEELGAGQFGIVYRARKRGFAGDSFSAIKVVEISYENNGNGFSAEQIDGYLASVAHNYAREIRMMESVKGYSNIVSIEDYTVCSNSRGEPWYVVIRMELLTSLYEYLENKEINDDQIIRIGVDLCKALEICRSRKIVHRDIKPANVFVNNDGVFKLGDFGVARQILENTSQTRTGSPDFMAPEVYHGELKTADFEHAHSADIYSLGMLLYWMANGKRMPFIKQNGLITADEIAEAFNRKMSGEAFPDPVNASESLKKVILKACSFHPSERYETADKFMEALESAKNEQKYEQEKTLPSFQKKRMIITAAVALCAVLAVTGYFLLRPAKEVPPGQTVTREEPAALPEPAPETVLRPEPPSIPEPAAAPDTAQEQKTAQTEPAAVIPDHTLWIILGAAAAGLSIAALAIRMIRRPRFPMLDMAVCGETGVFSSGRKTLYPIKKPVSINAMGVDGEMADRYHISMELLQNIIIRPIRSRTSVGICCRKTAGGQEAVLGGMVMKTGKRYTWHVEEELVIRNTNGDGGITILLQTPESTGNGSDPGFGGNNDFDFF